jgi:hypothetical protein
VEDGDREKTSVSLCARRRWGRERKKGTLLAAPCGEEERGGGWTERAGIEMGCSVETDSAQFPFRLQNESILQGTSQMIG